jgi:hypothetical protein
VSREGEVAQILVLAKQPVAGRVKTRLCPPLHPDGAARVAAAAIEDTLEAVRQVARVRRVLVLDGSYPAAGFCVQPQCGGPMSERLGAAFDDAAATAHDGAGPLPALLIGMDTPQVSAELLTSAVEALLATPAVLGLAPDGGWWALGLQQPDGSLLRGIPTSQDDTGARQLAQLQNRGLQVQLLPQLRDVDTMSDALAVAELSPDGRFAQELRRQLGQQ